MFDVLVKRIHEYKRQYLQVLHIVSLYHKIKSNPTIEIQPRTVIFGGKAAPGYHLAKLMIKLITSVGDVVIRDPDVWGRLKVVFLPNFSVRNGQRVYPAADLSEQISTAGKEASGTGNMKFSMNGALTIGTLDGTDNFFLFGLSAAEVYAVKSRGYRPMDYYNGNQELRNVIDLICSGLFSRGDTELFRPLIDGLLYQDPYSSAGRFSVLYLVPSQGVRGLRRNRSLDTNVHSQHRPQRKILIGSHHSRILRRYLARQVGANSATHTCGSRNRIVLRSGSAAPHNS